MICKIFYRKVTGDVEKMRISKKEESEKLFNRLRIAQGGYPGNDL